MGNESTKTPQEELISICKKYQEFTIPLVALSAFRFGALSKKRKSNLKKECPEGYEYLVEFIEKGIDIMSSKNCKECELSNDSDADFCKKCGNKL